MGVVVALLLFEPRICDTVFLRYTRDWVSICVPAAEWRRYVQPSAEVNSEAAGLASTNAAIDARRLSAYAKQLLESACHREWWSFLYCAAVPDVSTLSGVPVILHATLRLGPVYPRDNLQTRRK